MKTGTVHLGQQIEELSPLLRLPQSAAPPNVITLAEINLVYACENAANSDSLCPQELGLFIS